MCKNLRSTTSPIELNQYAVKHTEHDSLTKQNKNLIYHILLYTDSNKKGQDHRNEKKLCNQPREIIFHISENEPLNSAQF